VELVPAPLKIRTVDDVDVVVVDAIVVDVAVGVAVAASVMACGWSVTVGSEIEAADATRSLAEFESPVVALPGLLGTTSFQSGEPDWSADSDPR
jgi:hypothetical protein